MWKEYSLSYIRRNKASSGSIVAAAFISALFLSFLCSMFYNIWRDEVDQIIREEGDWQGRITGELGADELAVIDGFANVERAVVREDLSGSQGMVVDLYFSDSRRIFRDMPLLLERLGLEEEAASYHLLLLSRYLIHDPQAEQKPLLLTFYLVLLILMCASLILIIHNSFGVSMNARVHQLSIFSSIGATPAQLRACLMQEAAMLCLIPVLLGTVLGIVLSAGAIQGAGRIAESLMGGNEIAFSYQPAILLISLLCSALTVWVSAWLPARRLSKMTPLEAIRGREGRRLKKRRHSPVLSLLFGVEGELAGNTLKAQKRTLRTSTLSLTLSFLGFSMALCFFTLSEISTEQTYFERYKEAWDVMATVKDTKIEEFTLMEELQGLPGIRDAAVYQKAEALCRLPQAWQSVELEALGGIEALTGKPVANKDGSFLVSSPLIILDDAAFAAYCGQIGAGVGLDGAIVLNRIWDSLNSNFRYAEYIPYVKENQDVAFLQAGENEIVEIPIAAYTQQPPLLREEYEDYGLVLILPVSVWDGLSVRPEAEKDMLIRLLAREGVSPSELEELEKAMLQLVSREYGVESENRVQEKITNDQMIDGFMLVLGSFCSLLALMGIANVFSYTLGFLYQRKQELAQYLSVGMTPAGMRRMFCIEALVIAGRPLAVALPLTAAFVAFAVRASYLEPAEFLVRAPILPIAVFAAVVFGFVAFAYYLGGRRVLRCKLAEALRSDTVA